MSEGTRHVMVCQGGDCKAKGGEPLMAAVEQAVGEAGLANTSVCAYQCFGACATGPHVVVDTDRAWYSGVASSDVPAVVAALTGGPAPEHLTGKVPGPQQEMIFSLIEMGVIPLP